MARAKGGKPQQTGAQALKEAVHVGYVRAGYTSLMQLSIAAGVSYDTFMNWFGGKTRPRGAELQRVAKTIDVPYADLEAAYEGRAREPQPLAEAVADLTYVIRELVAEIREDRERGQDAASAMIQAAGLLGTHPSNGGGTASTGRAAPRGTRE